MNILNNYNHKKAFIITLFLLAASQSFFCSDILPSGKCLSQGESIVSTNGANTLVLQGDGNFVLYCPGGYRWASFVFSGFQACMLTNGNLVIYNNTNSTVWSTGTSGHPGAFLKM
jgi:hypothetical protein